MSNTDGSQAILQVKAKPRSPRPGLKYADGILTVAVAEPAVDGAANEAIRKAIARVAGVAPSRVTLTSGPKSKLKTFEIEGISQQDLVSRLAQGGPQQGVSNPI